MNESVLISRKIHIRMKEGEDRILIIEINNIIIILLNIFNFESVMFFIINYKSILYEIYKRKVCYCKDLSN